MKFFSKVGSTRGGSAATPTAETTTSLNPGGKSHAAAGGSTKVKPTSSSRHWKPTLNIISEDSPVVYEMRRSCDNEFPAKLKAKSTGKVKLPSHGQDYWKSYNLWTMMPAFPGTPF